ncbi:CRP-like cAMP-activated global transcriptional regulator [Anaerolineales bacterium]|nr:CRP-like cAMP-activated global transcriptional regulator [Anaerolineales bacterium]
MPDLITLLKHAEVLGNFTDSQKERLVSMSLKRILKRGESLFWQGDLWPNVLLIVSGKLQSVIQSLDGKSYIVSAWEKGDEFWAHTLFDGGPMPSTLEAAQESVIYQWDGETVLGILFDNSEAVRALLGRQVRLIRKRRETISDLAFQPVTSRLAKLILEQVPASENSAQRDLTLDQIASMVASSPEVVCRTLYHLQREGFLRVTRASITLHDRAALERLVGAE